jgi:hypothetical protein
MLPWARRASFDDTQIASGTDYMIPISPRASGFL